MKAYLNNTSNSLKESVDFFASQDKFIRESWVVSNFLTNMSIPFAESDLVRGSDPPDVVFHDAQFEVKEILDRKRHAEFKQAFVRAKAATNPAELLEAYSPKDISIQEIFARVHSVATDLTTRKYSLEVRKKLDLLCYINLKDVMRLNETPSPDITSLAELGYRSVSILDGYRSCIFYAAHDAPSFLQVQPGIIHRAVP